MSITRTCSAAAVLVCLVSVSAFAAENTLTPKEKAAGWRLLFNGKDHAGWMCNNGKEVAAPIEEGSLVPYKSGGYLILHKQQYGDFVLKCEVKMPEKCNSGIFFRVGDPKNPVQSGFEIQVMTGTGTGFHDFGAIYDLDAPKKNTQKKPGEWNTIEITCKGPHISVKTNGVKVSEINCDDFTEPGRCPDGTKNKFKLAVKAFPRKGYLGFQDHGHKVWYRNVKIRELKD